MLSSLVRVHFSCLYFVCPKKHLLPFIRIQRAFVPNFFQKNLPSLLVAQLLRRLYEKNLVVEKKSLITDRDKNRSFDSLFSKNSEIFSPFKTSPYLIRQIFAFWAVSHRKKTPHCIGHGNAIFRSLFEKIHRSFTFPNLRCLFASLQKSPSI